MKWRKITVYLQWRYIGTWRDLPEVTRKVRKTSEMIYSKFVAS